MTVYLVNIAFIGLWALVFLGPKKKLAMANPEKYFSIIAAVQWILVSGLRHINVGADTKGYKTRYFDIVRNQSWHKLWENFMEKI